MAQRWQRWIALTRPRTLLSGLAPVLVAVGYALYRGYSPSWVLCLLLGCVAVSAQIASNIANDLYDHRRGADTAGRQGPERPLSKGLITEGEVRLALGFALLALFASGLGVLALTSWWLVGVALFVVLGVFAYSSGPYPLAYHGLGDVAVLVYFGWTPILVSYYALTGVWGDFTLWLIATSVGLASVNILLVNNYRDYEEDCTTGKRTSVVRLGRDFAPRMYLSMGLLSMLLLYPLYSAWGLPLLCLGYGVPMLRTYKHLISHTGQELNGTLVRTARNVLCLAFVILALLALKTLSQPY